MDLDPNHVQLKLSLQKLENLESYIVDFNKYLDGISVMSSQVKKHLIDCGFSKPISVNK